MGFRPIFGIALFLVGVVLACGPASGAAYRYKDSTTGQRLDTDRPPPPGHVSQSVALGGGGGVPLNMTVEPRSTDEGVALVAINQCQCIVEFAVKARTPDGEKLGRGTVPPQSERVLLEVAAADGPAEIRYEYGYVVGEPGAQHRPAQPYRSPFALAQRFQVTQAPPDAVTHVDPSSRNAVDIAMPVGTAVYAAREGVVINVAARHFRTGLNLQGMDEANFVQILHNDGTYAICAPAARHRAGEDRAACRARRIHRRFWQYRVFERATPALRGAAQRWPAQRVGADCVSGRRAARA